MTAYYKLISHHETETIEVCLVPSTISGWALCEIELGAAKNFMINYVSLLEQINDEGSLADDKLLLQYFLRILLSHHIGK